MNDANTETRADEAGPSAVLNYFADFFAAAQRFL
jgi:hypothetical protein